MKLAYSLIEQGKGENVIKLLGRLPAPCIGGWYPLGDTCFGPGWKRTSGTILNEYFLSVGTPSCMIARDKILRPPDDPLWEGMGEIYQDTLYEAGVFDGLRLIEVKPEDWKSDFEITGGHEICLPVKKPPGISEVFWHKYRDYVMEELEPYFSTSFKYEMQTFFLFPSFDGYNESSENSKQLLAELIFLSIPQWSQTHTWKKTQLKKDGGQYHVFNPISPLFLFLRACLKKTPENTIYSGFREIESLK